MSVWTWGDFSSLQEMDLLLDNVILQPVHSVSQGLLTNLLVQVFAILINCHFVITFGKLCSWFVLCVFVPEWPTFRDVHGIQAAQQVSDVQVVAFLPAQPVVAGEGEAQVRPVHVRHHHPVQKPAGVHPRVVMLDPGEATVVVCEEFIPQVVINELTASHVAMPVWFDLHL